MSKPKTLRSKQPLNLRLDDELNVKLEGAMKKTGLSKSDLARLSLERGLKIVMQQLCPEDVAA